MAEAPELYIQEDVFLKDRTTFRVGGVAHRFVEVSSREELRVALVFAEQHFLPIFLLGGGSNLLVSDRGFSGLVVAVAFRSIDVLEETEKHVTVRVDAGKSLDEFVAFAVEQDWWGVENLSLIPGTVGAMPIQNVGAYGQEASQVVTDVEVMEIASKEVRSLSVSECGFAYRRSIFNRDEKGRYIVLSVTFKLWKSGEPNLSHSAVRNMAYPPPANKIEFLRKKSLSLLNLESPPCLQRMREIIVHLREDGRLPDLEKSGNAGSFFQSPFVQKEQINECKKLLREKLSKESADDLFHRCYETDSGIKVPSADLIKVAGATGFSVGGAALYAKNPAILVNQAGGASAKDVLELTRRVRQAVFDISGLLLPVEPEQVGFESRELDSFMEVGT